MFNKTPTRLPEALWLSFEPRITKPEETFINKLGQWVSPSTYCSALRYISLTGLQLISSKMVHNTCMGIGTALNIQLPIRAHFTYERQMYHCYQWVRPIPSLYLLLLPPLPTEFTSVCTTISGLQSKFLRKKMRLYFNSTTSYIMWYPYVVENTNELFRFEMEFSS